MDGQPGSGGQREDAHRVVVHPELVDGRKRQLQVFAGLGPPAPVHRHDRQLGLGEDEGADIALRRRDRGRLHEERAAGLSSPSRRCASADKTSAEARHAPHGGSAAKLASLIICLTPSRHIRARSNARDESNDAVPSAGVRSNEAGSTNAAHLRASAVCPVRTAARAASTASGGYSGKAVPCSGAVTTELGAHPLWTRYWLDMTIEDLDVLPVPAWKKSFFAR